MSKFALQDVQLLAAMSPPGGSSNEVSGRMLRHLNVITLHDFSETTMTHIFSNIVNIHFKASVNNMKIQSKGVFYRV